MSFYCRGVATYSNLQPGGYRYIDAHVVASNNSLSDPYTLADAQAVCDRNTNYPLAIEAQILFADGSSRSFFEGVSRSDVIEVSGLICLAWAVAWGIKSIRRTL